MSLDSFDPDAPASGDGLFGLPHTPDEAAVVVIPVPFEATASYRRGTRDAPDAVLEASRQVDLHDLETGEPWRAGIAMEPVDPRFAAWNDEAQTDALAVIANGGADPGDAERAARVDAIMRKMNALVRDRTAAVLARGRIPAILGGDHSVPFGAIEAAAAKYPGIGLLHVDAHADLRDAYEGFTWSHASIMHNVMTRIADVGYCVQVGIRDIGAAERAFTREHERMSTYYAPEIAWEIAGGEPFRRMVNRMIEPLPENVWITFDIDGLDPALCPSTGTPVPGGLSWDQALVLLRVLGTSGRRIVGFDLNEVGGAEWDAIVGARLLYKLAGWALASRRR
jgi:agmatinase